MGTPTGLDPLPEPGPQVQTRLQSTSGPECFALYSVRDGSGPGRGAKPPWLAVANHTLVAVREFRRVPLDASALALLLFTARTSAAVRVIARLAHSLEQPQTSVVLAAVHEGRALQWARPSPLSLDSVLPEVRPWLDAEPERYVYCPESVESPAVTPPLLSPFAV